MLRRKALITGITGQDGLHLTGLLIKNDYDVSGIVRSLNSPTTLNFIQMYPKVKLYLASLNSFEEISEVLSDFAPDEIYNFGGISFVGTDISKSMELLDTTGLSFLRLIESCRILGAERGTRIYQSSSSEIFGCTDSKLKDESSPMEPESVYGIAKATAHNLGRIYRKNHGMHISIGVLFNHEGEHRRYEYVTRKITSSIARIKLGTQSKIVLGDLNAARDWGYAGDYVEAIFLMMQKDEPSEYVIASGVTHTVREFVETALEIAGLDPIAEKYVIQDKSLFRPSFKGLLAGESAKAQRELGWAPQENFHSLIQIMLENDLRIEACRK